VKILIFLHDGVTALDAIGPYESLARLPDTQIVFVGSAKGPVKTGDGFLTLHVDADIGTEMAADMLIVPGGGKAGLLRTLADQRLLAWIGEIDWTTRWTCSVCTGSLILGAAGLLKGRRASPHWRAKAGFGLSVRICTSSRYSVRPDFSAMARHSHAGPDRSFSEKNGN
jgi:putative intracellular protease/amidase